MFQECSPRKAEINTGKPDLNRAAQAVVTVQINEIQGSLEPTQFQRLNDWIKWGTDWAKKHKVSSGLGCSDRTSTERSFLQKKLNEEMHLPGGHLLSVVSRLMQYRWPSSGAGDGFLIAHVQELNTLRYLGWKIVWRRRSIKKLCRNFHCPL